MNSAFAFPEPNSRRLNICQYTIKHILVRLEEGRKGGRGGRKGYVNTPGEALSTLCTRRWLEWSGSQKAWQWQRAEQPPHLYLVTASTSISTSPS
jgi:hypothetical protein